MRRAVQRTGRWAAPVAALAVYVLLPATELTHAGRATAAVAVWMAAWWMTEAIPVYATSLLPLALLPLLGAGTLRETSSPYGHELIYLFLGGFVLALAMERWNLHRRIALSVLKRAGTDPPRMLGAFMAVTALLSMWVSNTATAVMMLPIAISVIDLTKPSGAQDLTSPSTQALEAGLDRHPPRPADAVPKKTSAEAPSARSARDASSADENGRGPDRPASEDGGPNQASPSEDFAISLLLAIAYSASIGGVATLIGTPPNLFLASYVESHLGTQIGFVRWMVVGLPFAAVFLLLTWWLLTRVFHPTDLRIAGGSATVGRAHAALGPLSHAEKRVAAVFLATATAWISRPLLNTLEIANHRPLAGLTDPGIAILAALALFLLPAAPRRTAASGSVERVMDWETARRLPWGLLLLFGGGLSLAAAIRRNGLGEWLGGEVAALGGVPSVVLVLLVSALVIFLTELTSNTATTATLVPILAALAPGLGVDPFHLIVPAAMAASCAFMLPVATPPNAIIFGSGHVTVPQMCRVGLWLNLVGIALITAATYALVLPFLAAGVGR